MAGELKKMWVVCVLPLVFNILSWVGAEPLVPCFFIFGDSLFDNGNNNRLPTLAKVNYPPYGIDFADGPTGRFCNGRTTTDVTAELLGFDDYIPPYSTARGQDILRGVNYASGAAGIRDETGWQLGDRISMNEQLRNYQNTVSQLVDILGNNDLATIYLSKCMYSVGMGNNDYINNYFMPKFYDTSGRYTPEQYADVLIQQYSQQLTTLYNSGARKVVVLAVGLIGCTPAALAQYNIQNGSQCVESFNSAAQLFNDRLKYLVDDLNNRLSTATFVYTNSNDFFLDILKNPSNYGFRVTNTGCCDVGSNTGQCLPLRRPCQNRTEYMFWDAFHPSEALNVIIAKRAFSAQFSSDAYPIDIHRLAEI